MAYFLTLLLQLVNRYFFVKYLNTKPQEKFLEVFTIFLNLLFSNFGLRTPNFRLLNQKYK